MAIVLSREKRGDDAIRNFVAKPQVEGETHAPAAATGELVPGINPAFLRDRLAVPLGFINGVARWGLADLANRDTLAALRFASQAPIAPVQLTEEAILALLNDGAKTIRTQAAPHADAVVELRSYLVEAFAAEADRIEIDGAAGTLVASKAGVAIASHAVGMTRAKALAAAADALVTSGAGDRSRLSVAYRDTRVWVTVEPSGGGVALLLDFFSET